MSEIMKDIKLLLVRACGPQILSTFERKTVSVKPRIIRDTHTNSKVVVLCCSQHANLGDMALNFAEASYLQARTDKTILFHYGSAIAQIDILKQLIDPEDIIYLHGGGNMGSLYEKEEYNRAAIVNAFPHNQIIMFPQTVSFDQTDHAKHLLSYLQNVYSKHKNLHFFARELMSYKRMQNYYPSVDIRISPDIVLSLPREIIPKASVRFGLGICLRDDKESALDDCSYQRLVDAGRPRYSSITKTDTTLDGKGSSFLNPARGDDAVKEKLYELSSYELVVTDRIHGMIFCALTGTPCIGLDNSNGKVRAEYDWLKSLSYIRFARSVEEAALLVQNEITEPGAFPFREFANKFRSLDSLIV